MDEVAAFNKERWEELAQAGVMYSRPYLDLDRDSARARRPAQRNPRYRTTSFHDWKT